MNASRLAPYMEGPSLAASLELFFSSDTYFVRAIEELAVETEFATRRVSLELCLPDLPVLVPVAFPLRGKLFPTLRISGGGKDAANYALGSADTRTFTAKLLQAAVLVLSLPSGLERATLDVAERLTDSDDEGELLFLIRGLASAFEELPEEGRSARAQLLKTFRNLVTRSALLVPVNSQAAYQSIVYDYEIAQGDLRQPGLREAVRTYLGRLPDTLQIDLPLAERPQTYHLELRAPDLHYIRGLELRCRRLPSTGHPRRVQRWKAQPVSGSGVAGVEPNPVGSCHVYIKRAELAPEDRNLMLTVTFAEKPTGELFNAMVRLLITAVVVAYLGVVGDTLVVTQPASAIAFLFAVPGLLGVSLFLAGTSKALRGPLAARLANLTVALLAVVASSSLISWTVTAQAEKASRADATPLVSFPAPDGVAAILTGVIACCLLGAAWVGVNLTRNIGRYRGARRQNLLNARGGLFSG